MTKKRKYLLPYQTSTNKIVMSYIPKVEDIIKKLEIPKDYHEDLINAGVLGVLEALKSFPPDSPNFFSRYVERYILNEIGAFLKTQKDMSGFTINPSLNEIKAFYDDEFPINPLFLTDSSESFNPDIRKLENQVLNNIEVEELISTLTSLESEIVIFYFGLFGEYPRTLREIGNMLNMPHTTVAKKLKSALKKCYSILNNRKLEEFKTEYEHR